MRMVRLSGVVGPSLAELTPSTAYAAIRRGATFLFAINFLSGFNESTTQTSDRYPTNTSPCRCLSTPCALSSNYIVGLENRFVKLFFQIKSKTVPNNSSYTSFPFFPTNHTIWKQLVFYA
jgi:hypothetical protein